MQVELNHKEVELIEQALDAWERDPSGGAMVTGMLGLMLTTKDERPDEKSRFETEMDKAQMETRKRKVQSTLLRAKLIQASAQIAEHCEGEVPSGNP